MTASPLADYVHLKQDLADGLRAALTLLKGAQQDQGAEAMQELLMRLASDRFNLVVLGQFKRGKSSLINALIGRPVLPTAAVPLTSVVTSLRYGSPPSAWIRFERHSLPLQVSIPELVDYVTETGNPGNRRGVRSAEAVEPSVLLRRGAAFVDTPGVGSTNQDNTATTYAFLPEADAAIFVTSAEAPLSEDEIGFLAAIRQHVRKIFFVLNKIDQLAPDEQGEVARYTETVLRGHLESGAIRLFLLSARSGLRAKLEDASALLAESGIPALEEALTAFLIEGRGSAFLVGLLDRAIRAVEETMALPSPLPSADVAPASETPLNQPQAGLRQLRYYFTKLRMNLLDGTPAALAGAPRIGSAPVSALSAPTPPNGRQSAPQFALDGANCPICAAVEVAVFDYLRHAQYVLASDLAAQQAHRAAGGFCRVHTWQLESLSSSQGLARGYPPLIERAASEVRALASVPGASAANRLNAFFPDDTACSVCKAQRRSETDASERLIELLQTSEGTVHFRRRGVVCLPHLRSLLQLNPPDDIRELLISREASWLDDLAETQRAFALKVEGRRRDLIGRVEEASSRQGIRILSGSPRLR